MCCKPKVIQSRVHCGNYGGQQENRHGHDEQFSGLDYIQLCVYTPELRAETPQFIFIAEPEDSPVTFPSKYTGILSQELQRTSLQPLSFAYLRSQRELDHSSPNQNFFP